MSKTNPTVRVITATQAKNKFGEMIKHAYAANDHLIVEKSGVPVVAIISMAEYRQWVNSKTVPPESIQVPHEVMSRAEAAERLKRVMDQVHARMPDVPEEEVDRDIMEAIQEVRAEEAKKAKRIAKERRAKYAARRKRARGK